MKIKILGAPQSLRNVPQYDPQNHQTGTMEVPYLELIAVPAGDNPQSACIRLNIVIHGPDDATLTKYRPGAVFDLAEFTTAEAERANAAFEAANNAPAGA